MSLSLYDGVMLVIVIVCVIQGALKGMAWQLAPIASLVLGYLFAMPLSSATAQWFGQPPLNRVFAMITMYMLVSLGVYLIARSLRDSIEKMKLVEFDRHLGALLGGVKGVLFTTVATIGLLCVWPASASLIVHSESRTIAENIIGFVEPLFPHDVQKVIDPYLKPIEDLPDDDPRPIVKEKSPFEVDDVAHTEDEELAPRRRRSQPIFEDDAETPLDDPDSLSSHSRRRQSIEDRDEMEDEPAPRRRRSTTNDDSAADEFDAARGEDSFGDDPSQAFEDERPPRRR